MNFLLGFSITLNILFFVWIVKLLSSFDDLKRSFEVISMRSESLNKKMSEEITLIIQEKKKLEELRLRIQR